MKNENIQVIDPVNAPGQAIQKTTITISDNNIYPAELETLKKEFQVNTITYTQSSQSTYNVLVIVGEDYNVLEL